MILASAWVALVGAFAISRTLPPPLPDENSVYAGLSLPVWLLLGGAFVGFGSQALARPAKDPTLIRLSGFAGLVLISLTLQAIPHLRGYEFFGRGDSATHLGTLGSIISTGRLPPNDFYPAALLIASQLVVFAGIPIQLLDVAGRLLPQAVFTLGSIALARGILGSRKWDSMVAVASLLPLAGGYIPDFSPAPFGTALAPLVIATFLPEIGSTVMGRRARTLILPTFAFIHPLGCLVLLGVAIVVQVVSRLVRNTAVQQSPVTRQGYYSTGATLLAVSLAAWIAPSLLFRTQLIVIRDALLSGTSQSPGQFAMDLANRAHLDLFGFIAIPVAMNVGVVLAAMVGFFACAWALTVQRARWSGRRDRIAILIGIQLLLGLAFIATLISPTHLDVFRFLHFFMIIIPVLLGMVAAVLGLRRWALSGVLLIGIGLASIPFIYASPWIKQPAEFVPKAEVVGVQWLLAENEGPGALRVTTIQSLDRLVDLAIGPEARSQRPEFSNRIPVPDHFGAQGGDTVHLGNPDPVVLTVSVADIVDYTGIWSSADRFTPDDFVLLSRDGRISRVYSNNALDIYIVQSDLSAPVAGSGSQ